MTGNTAISYNHVYVEHIHTHIYIYLYSSMILWLSWNLTLHFQGMLGAFGRWFVQFSRLFVREQLGTPQPVKRSRSPCPPMGTGLGLPEGQTDFDVMEIHGEARLLNWFLGIFWYIGSFIIFYLFFADQTTEAFCTGDFWANSTAKPKNWPSVVKRGARN